MKNKFILTFLSFICAAYALAQSADHEICKAYEEFNTLTSNGPSKFQTLKFSLRHTYLKKSLVDVKENPAEIEDNRDSFSIKLAYVAFGGGEIEVESSKIKAKEIKHLIKENLSIRKEISHILKGSKTLENCLTRLEESKFDSENFIKRMNDYKVITNEIIGPYNDRREAFRIEKFLKKRNWDIKVSKSFKEMYNEISSSVRKVDVILILHADDAGRLYDSFGQVIPKTFFKSLNDKISSLNIYSCYSENVVKNYFPEGAQFSVYTPVLRKMAKVFLKDKMPASYFEAFYKKIKFSNINTSRTIDNNFRQRMNIQGDLNADLEAYVNGIYVGSVDSEKRTFSLPSHILKNENTIVLKSTNKIISHPNRNISFLDIPFSVYVNKHDDLLSYMTTFRMQEISMIEEVK